jgi:hypothetical protein
MWSTRLSYQKFLIKKVLSFEENVIPRLVENDFNVALYKNGHYFICILEDIAI